MLLFFWIVFRGKYNFKRIIAGLPTIKAKTMDALMVVNSYLYLDCKLFKTIDGFDLMKAYNLTPNILTGIATNTLAGYKLVENLCNVRALNLTDPKQP